MRALRRDADGEIDESLVPQTIRDCTWIQKMNKILLLNVIVIVSGNEFWGG